MQESYESYMKRRSREEDEKQMRSRLPSVRERYAEFLENCADEIVVIELQNAYETCVEEGDEDMMYCIRKILQYYMPASEYNIWRDVSV
jgi:thymidylate kinase